MKEEHLTPVDIEHKKFDHSFRGYNTAQVDEFLDQLLISYEELYRESGELKKKVESLEEQLGRFKEIEESMKKAILSAEKTSEDILGKARSQIAELQKKKETFILEFKTFLQTNLNYLEDMSKKLDLSEK